MTDPPEVGPNPFLEFRSGVLVPGTSSVDPARAARLGVEVVQRFDPELELKTLRAISVASPDRYQEAIREAARTVDADFVPRSVHAKEAGALATAVKGRDEDVVVMREGPALALFSESGWQVAWNSLHHALAHVHDNARDRAGMRPAVSLMASPAQAAALALSIALWSEYHATRRASQTYGDVGAHIPSLVRAIRAYPAGDRSLRDLEVVFRAAGCVLGGLPVGSSNLMAIAPAAAMVVLSSPLGRIWPLLPRVLDAMYLSGSPRDGSFHEELSRLVTRFWTISVAGG